MFFISIDFFDYSMYESTRQDHPGTRRLEIDRLRKGLVDLELEGSQGLSNPPGASPGGG